jgi:hypothetical protein
MESVLKCLISDRGWGECWGRCLRDSAATQLAVCCIGPLAHRIETSAITAVSNLIVPLAKITNYRKSTAKGYKASPYYSWGPERLKLSEELSCLDGDLPTLLFARNQVPKYHVIPGSDWSHCVFYVETEWIAVVSWYYLLSFWIIARLP